MEVTGTKSLITATSGSLTPRRTRIGGPIRMATGLIPMSAGHGYRMRILAGLLITTVAGFDWKTMAGAGFRVTNGGRPGCPGGLAETILVGHPYRRQEVAKSSTKADQSADMSMSISESGRPTTTSSIFVLSASRS